MFRKNGVVCLVLLLGLGAAPASRKRKQARRYPQFP
jgi:hypothetical protein